jgi:hypothetical protein
LWIESWFDILTDLKVNDSFCKTRMPARENVLCRIDVSVVRRAIASALLTLEASFLMTLRK